MVNKYRDIRWQNAKYEMLKRCLGGQEGSTWIRTEVDTQKSGKTKPREMVITGESGVVAEGEERGGGNGNQDG